MIHSHIDPKYEHVETLRDGGTRAVFLVRHRLLDELRVIKVLRSQLTADEELRRGFLREAKTALQLRHSNIARLYDFSIDAEGTAWIVLEHVDGVTLEQYARQPEARHLPLTLAIAQQGLRALAYLHGKGLVHRDIAPDNLMLTRDVDGGPLVKLIDSGLLEILAGRAEGTPAARGLGRSRYSSPERLLGREIDARGDLYSFGILLYELVTGVSPIRSEDHPSQVADARHREPIGFDDSDPSGVVPESLRRLILDAMAEARDLRIPSAEEFSRRLAQVAETLAAGPAGESRRLFERACERARRERERALLEAEAAVRGRLEQADLGAARARIAQAIERLGDEPRLAALLEEIQALERQRYADVAETSRLDRLADAAAAALERGDLADATSKLFELLTCDPQHTRGRALQERIDPRRRRRDANAGAAHATEEGAAPNAGGAEPPAPRGIPAAEAPKRDLAPAGAPAGPGLEPQRPTEGSPTPGPARRGRIVRAALIVAGAAGLTLAAALLYRSSLPPTAAVVREGTGAEERFARELERAEEKLARVHSRLDELRRLLESSPAAADLWRRSPELASQEREVARLATEAERALAAARARADILEVEAADERIDDALSRLEALLAEAARAPAR